MTLAAFIKALNAIGLHDARQRVLDNPAAATVLTASRYTNVPALQPSYAEKIARGVVKTYRIEPDSGRWKGKAHPDQRNWVYGDTAEEVLWKISVLGMERKADIDALVSLVVDGLA